MLLSRAKGILTTKKTITGGIKEINDNDLNEIFNEAMAFVAMRCIPLSLYSVREEGVVPTDVLRNLSDGNYLRNPLLCTDNAAEIDIDESLVYAVINKAAALCSRDSKDIAKFENEARENINRYKANYNKGNE